MKTLSTKRIKEIKATMKRINGWLAYYQEAEVVREVARNVRTYDESGEQMKNAFDAIMQEMQNMLYDIDSLGCSCNAIDVMDFFRIEKYTLNEKGRLIPYANK